jgi:hypothetical protein
MDYAVLKYVMIWSAGAKSENLGIVIGEIAAMPKIFRTLDFAFNSATNGACSIANSTNL